MWTLNATGGSGNYRWNTLNSTVAVVDESGRSRFGIVHGKYVGETWVTVSDAKNKLNSATIQVIVTPIGSLQWLEEQMEIEVGTIGEYSSLIAFDINGYKYTNCSSVKIEYNEPSTKWKGLSKDSLDWREIKQYAHSDLELLKLSD